MRVHLLLVALSLAAALDDHDLVADLAPAPSMSGAVGTPVGPPHGLPGYKESHDWVHAVDEMSPLVFAPEVPPREMTFADAVVKLCFT